MSNSNRLDAPIKCTACLDAFPLIVLVTPPKQAYIDLLDYLPYPRRRRLLSEAFYVLKLFQKGPRPKPSILLSLDALLEVVAYNPKRHELL